MLPPEVSEAVFDSYLETKPPMKVLEQWRRWFPQKIDNFINSHTETRIIDDQYWRPEFEEVMFKVYGTYPTGNDPVRRGVDRFQLQVSKYDNVLHGVSLFESHVQGSRSLQSFMINFYDGVIQGAVEEIYEETFLVSRITFKYNQGKLIEIEETFPDIEDIDENFYYFRPHPNLDAYPNNVVALETYHTGVNRVYKKPGIMIETNAAGGTTTEHIKPIFFPPYTRQAFGIIGTSEFAEE